MCSICFGVALRARCTNHAAREAGDERSRTLKRTDACGFPEKTESRGVIEAARCGHSESRRRSGGRQFKSAGSGNEKVRSRDRPTSTAALRRQALQWFESSFAPSSLEKSVFFIRLSRDGSIQKRARHNDYARLVARLHQSPSDRRCCATIAGNLSRYDRCSVAMV